MGLGSLLDVIKGRKKSAAHIIAKSTKRHAYKKWAAKKKAKKRK